MRVSKSMEEIWRIKEETGKLLEGKSVAEVLNYFREREPDWAKDLPRRENVPPKSIRKE
ncbi:MAG: hypothetical protein KC917_01325 [Candidatus Omnitrophica bacterium]|nr:hypothetical protein [Candidatus Omnitrophota bacterium]MCA9414873.1 hypothetical protein [Candidatus Omnitrophota bacterium]MCA9423842.1 hypothetical protein [Candidatus Omnitrophota bacterium]MCA9430407.1 hypothetical protein [Candidatus Omnitrophota bacterium]MCA9434478.1 hypothetical protein [Candidatus Omnitrophota bacterium]